MILPIEKYIRHELGNLNKTLIFQMENLLSTITLVSAIVFFFCFFLSMYAHVKVSLICIVLKR